MLQVAALEIIQSEFHFTLTQSKYWLEAREGGLGELMKPWGKRIVFRKKNVMGIQPDGRVEFASFYSISCGGRIFRKLEWRYRQKKIKAHMGQCILMRKTVFPPNCFISVWCQAVFSASPSPFYKGAVHTPSSSPGILSCEWRKWKQHRSPEMLSTGKWLLLWTLLYNT